MALIVTYPRHCNACSSSFDAFLYKKDAIEGGIQIIHCCPICGKEIPAEFVEENHG